MSVHDANYKKIKKELGIPEQEPIFVIRAQDKLAVPTIARYRNLAAQIEKGGPNQEWFDQLREVEDAFAGWQTSSETKVPD